MDRASFDDGRISILSCVHFNSKSRHDDVLMGLRPALFRFWFRLQCLASEQPDGHSIRHGRRAIAADLGMSLAIVDRYVSELVSLGIVREKMSDDSSSWDVRNLLEPSSN